MPMAPQKILICGGGVAGPSLAFWLARAGHNVTIVERFAALRASGAQIDLRAQGIGVVKRMGLIDVIRSKCVDQPGVCLVDSNDKVIATILANKSGKGAQSLTSEYEIMRGDLVRVFYDATRDKVNYIFGKTVDRFEQDDKCVKAYFSDGQSDTYDLLVGADGQGSRIRKALLGPDAPDPIRHIGLYIAYWNVPRIDSDTNMGKSYHAPGSRLIFSGSTNPDFCQVAFNTFDDSEEARALPRASLEKQKEYWTRRFEGAGWQTDRFIKGMQTTENFYCQEALQVRTDTWHKGRVVLLGDAAHCPSPFTAMGTTGALVGAYVLAGEVNNCDGDIPIALANYDKILRPFATEFQKLNPAFLRLGFPQTEWGVAVLRTIASVVCFLRIPDLIARFSAGDKKGGFKLPEYPDMKVE